MFLGERSPADSQPRHLCAIVVQGAKEIYNLAGGIDAYSEVDPSIPRY